MDKQLDSIPDDTHVPQNGGLCFINRLPPELLSWIIQLCSMIGKGRFKDGEVDDSDRVWDYLRSSILGGRFMPSTYDSDSEMSEQLDDDGGFEDGSGEEESGEEDEGEGSQEGESQEGEWGEEGEDDEENENEDEEDGEEPEDTDDGSDSFCPAVWAPFPIVASHVCRHWRDIVLSAPSLWTDIKIYPEKGGSYTHEWIQLERSRNLPLNIEVSLYGLELYHAETPSSKELRDVYSTLISHIHHWGTLRVDVSEYHFMYVMLMALADSAVPAPQLTALNLRYWKDATEFIHPRVSKRFTLFGGFAPLLTRVSLWGVHVDWNQPWIASASNLEDLELACHIEGVRPSWVQFAAILRGASSLKKLTLHQSGPSGDPAEWFIESTPGSPSDLNAPINLSRVTQLVLAFHSQARAIGLFRKFYLPAIKILVLAFNTGDYTDLVRVLAGPATSLSPTSGESRCLLNGLEGLKIAGLPCHMDCAEILYAELQNLTSLSLSSSRLPSSFVDILSAARGGRRSVWLPRLEKLYVSGMTGFALRELFEKRKDAGVPLSHLGLNVLDRDVPDKDADWLKQNVQTFKHWDVMLL